MFFDEVNVSFKAGKGGDGCFSFRRARFEPKGGPDGGNGGRGGDVYILGDENVADLTDFRFKPGWDAQNGAPGRGSNQHGAGGEDLVLKLPVGTVVVDRESGDPVSEVLSHGARVLLLEGGEGGKGNTMFKSSINQAPREFTLGKPGDGGEFRLIIKTIADVGLIGFPNAGKSTLINLLTNAHPKIGAYPFTTMFPTVGVLEFPQQSERITLADIPGLIEGASENRGLGHRFLKHVERCKVLLIMIDLQGTDGREPISDYKVLQNELKLYKASLSRKPIFVAGNKMDEPQAPEHFKAFEQQCQHAVYPISCVSDEGFEVLKQALLEAVLELRRVENAVVEGEEGRDCGG